VWPKKNLPNYVEMKSVMSEAEPEAQRGPPHEFRGKSIGGSSLRFGLRRSTFLSIIPQVSPRQIHEDIFQCGVTSHESRQLAAPLLQMAKECRQRDVRFRN